MRIKGDFLFVHYFVQHSSRYYAGMVALANLIFLVQILTAQNLPKGEVTLALTFLGYMYYLCIISYVQLALF